MNELLKKLSPVVWTQVLNLFDVLCDLPQEAQETQMAEADLSDEARLVLQKMLANESGTNILNTSIDPLVESLLGEQVLNHSNPSDIVGRKFGAWKVTKPLASGGMGQVFIARRADGEYEKEVALKIIKSGQFSELSKQKFTEEMRTLAQFEHPNIARLIDGGTNDDDISYFVMELVAGSPICTYAEKHKLSLHERIKLVQQTINAVGYAHQNLVIHGDIKPANILVNEAGQIKLVDFGVARPLHVSSADIYLPQFTPGYSSPEQTKGDLLSTASDVFGLCAVLYELCTGSVPRKSESITTLVDYHQQLNNPIEKVYQRFKAQCKSGHGIALMNGLDPKVIDRALSKELGTIIDKGLQVDVSARYKNTTELNNDLQLFLAGSAVPNHANHFWYRFSKTWQKNKIPITISSAAVFGIVASAVFAFNQAAIAEQEAEKANWSNQFLLSIFTAADPVKNQQQPISVNELTGLAAEKILAEKGDVLLKTETLGLLSQIQYRLGQVKSAEQLTNEQIKLLNQQPKETHRLAAAHIHAGNNMEAQDNLEGAVHHFRQAMELAPLTDDVNEQSARAAMSLMNSLIRLNQTAEAAQIMLTLSSYEPDIAKLFSAHSLLASLYALKGKLALVEPDFKQALDDIAVAKSHALQVTDEPLLYPQILGIESDAFFNSGEALKAIEIDRELVAYFSEKFGKNHPETIDNLGRLAVSVASLGDMREGIRINQQIIDNLYGTEIKGHQMPAAYLNMGMSYRALNEHEKAIENFKKAQSLWPALEPRIPFYEASTDVGMARSLLALKKYEASKRFFEMALDGIKHEMGVNHPMFARFQIMYVPLLIEVGEYDEAESIIAKAHQLMVDTYGLGSKRTAVAKLRWAQLNAATGNSLVATQQAADVLDILDVPELKNRYQSEIALAEEISQLKTQ